MRRMAWIYMIFFFFEEKIVKQVAMTYPEVKCRFYLTAYELVQKTRSLEITQVSTRQILNEYFQNSKVPAEYKLEEGDWRFYYCMQLILYRLCYRRLEFNYSNTSMQHFLQRNDSMSFIQEQIISSKMYTKLFSSDFIIQLEYLYENYERM